MNVEHKREIFVDDPDFVKVKIDGEFIDMDRDNVERVEIYEYGDSDE